MFDGYSVGQGRIFLLPSLLRYAVESQASVQRLTTAIPADEMKNHFRDSDQSLQPHRLRCIAHCVMLSLPRYLKKHTPAAAAIGWEGPGIGV